MSSIFVSYRRADSRDLTERIHDRLVQAFKNENVFLDVDNHIPAGSNFPDVLMTSLNRSSVVLVIIGNKWLDIRENDDDTLRRLDNPADFVRIEVETALNEPFITVIPILVDGAHMPNGNDLPDVLKPLANIQAKPVRRNPYFHDDITELIKIIKIEFTKVESAKKQYEAELAREKEGYEQNTKEEALELTTQRLLDILEIPVH